MAVFQSKYRELSFYVNGHEHTFSSGTFATDDAEVIAVLETMTDAKRVDKLEEPEKPAKEEAKAPRQRKAAASGK